MANRFSLRIALIFFFALLCFTALFIKLVTVHIFPDPRARKLGPQEHYKTEIIQMERGNICDRTGQKLAVSIEMESVFARPEEIKYPEKCARELSKILDEDYGQILGKLRGKKTFVWLKRKVGIEKTKRIKQLRLEGIGTEREYRRFYPQKNLACHAVGFVGMDDDTGLEGVERYFNAYLKSEPVKLIFERDATGKIIMKKTHSIQAESGNNVYLTIDELIQHSCEEELRAICEQYKASGGSVIVMDPYTGEIFALANYPSYDLNDFRSAGAEVIKNRAVSDVFEPGSTFKVITAAALLDLGLVGLDDRFLCSGSLVRFGHKLSCHGKVHGSVNFEEVIEESCNVGIISAAGKISKRDFYDYMIKFGFGTPTGVELPGEVSGKIRKPDYWSGFSMMSLPIGQEVSATIMQMAVAISAIANGGYMVEPRIVNKITDSKGEIVKEFTPVIVRRGLVSKDTIGKLKQAMYAVIVKGTGAEAKIKGYTMGGKTGTAQKADLETGGYSADKFVSSFIGFFPLVNPRFIIYVVVDEPVGIHWGSVIAAPTFRRIVERIIQYVDIKPDIVEELINDKDAKAEKKKDGKKNSSERDLLIKTNTVPNVIGLSMANARQVLNGKGLDMKFYGSGRATNQEPLPGAVIQGSKREFTVKVWFSSE